MTDDKPAKKRPGKPRRKAEPDPWEVSEATPFTTAIEYRISEELRAKLLDELDKARTPACLGLARVLEAGPARMTLRVEWPS